LIGYPCSGKTFNADYLETVGWKNIDGDWIFSSTKPSEVKLAADLEAVIKKINHGETLSSKEKKQIEGYMKSHCDKAKVSAKKGVDTAISFICYTRWLRDYVRTLIPDVKFIFIDVDVQILLPRNRKRMENAAA